MAVVNITLSRSRSQAQPGGHLPVLQSVPLYKEDITPGVSHVVTTTAIVPSTGVADAMTLFWQITASGANVRVRFGSSPVATATGDILILDGQTREFGVTAPAEKVSVITATV